MKLTIEKLPLARVRLACVREDLAVFELVLEDAQVELLMTVLQTARRSREFKLTVLVEGK